MKKIAVSAAIAAVMASSAYAEKSGAFIGVDFGLSSSNMVLEGGLDEATFEKHMNEFNKYLNAAKNAEAAARQSYQTATQAAQTAQDDVNAKQEELDSILGQVIRLATPQQRYDINYYANKVKEYKNTNSIWLSDYQTRLMDIMMKVDTGLSNQYNTTEIALDDAEAALNSEIRNLQTARANYSQSQANISTIQNYINSLIDLSGVKSNQSSNNNFRYGIMGGYKWFFTDNFGVRAYGTLNMGKDNLKDGASYDAMNIGANADLLYNFLNMSQHSVGIFAGLNVGYAKYSGGVIDNIKNMYDLDPSGVNMGVNFGLRTIIANHHGIELLGRVGIYQTQSEKTKTTQVLNDDGTDLIDISANFKAYVEQKYSFGVRYVYNF